jgi:lysozyme family protein
MSTTSDDSRFDHCVAVVLAHEGGYVRHPSDPGGATNFGITQSTLARARGQRATEADVRLLSKEEACRIYRRFYWDPIRASEMPAGVALAVLDFAVNSGVPRAVRQLQSILQVEADGVVGPHTLRALSRADVPDLIRRLTRARLAFLARLSTWPVFGRGWRRRVLSVERDALRLVPASTPTSKKGHPR